jgi:hypothetical protein
LRHGNLLLLNLPLCQTFIVVRWGDFSQAAMGWKRGLSDRNFAKPTNGWRE